VSSCELFTKLVIVLMCGVDSAANHIASGTKVAIKRITPFDHAMFCQRTLREVKLLRHFRWVLYTFSIVSNWMGVA